MGACFCRFFSIVYFINVETPTFQRGKLSFENLVKMSFEKKEAFPESGAYVCGFL